MTRLANLDDEQVTAVAALVANIGSEGELPRALTPRELELIEQSKAAFREGRTLSLEEAEAYVEQQLTERRRRRQAAE